MDFHSNKETTNVAVSQVTTGGLALDGKKTRLNLIHYRADSTRTTTVETRPDLLILDSYFHKEIHVAVPQVTTGGLAPDTEISD